MAISLKHAFSSAKSDGTDATLVQPSNWNAEHTLTMATARLIGRTTSGTGAAEEIAVGTGLSLSSGTLSATAPTTVGTVTSGTWNADVIAGQYGGTGVANTGKTITLGGNFTTSGAFATTLTATATTSVTLPTSGTLATLAGTETFTNKTLTSPSMTSPTVTSGATISTGNLVVTAGSVGVNAASPAKKVTVEVADTFDGVRVISSNTSVSGVAVFEGISYRCDSNGSFGSKFAAAFRRSDGTAIASGARLGSLLFGGQYGTDTTFQSAKMLYSAAVHGVAEGSFTASNAMATAIAFHTGSTGDDAYNPNLTYGTERLRIESGGATRPGADNTYTLGTSGNRWSTVYAATSTINTSDARMKTDIADSVLGLGFIEALRPVSYRWIEGGNVEVDGELQSRPGTRTHYGLLAQEVRAALDAAGCGDFAGWVLTDKNDPDSTQGLRYDQFIPVLIKAVQELSARVKALETT